MRMLLYQGLTNVKAVGVSGIGQAIKQQARILDQLGIEVVTDPRAPFDAAQFNVPGPDSYRLSRKVRASGRPVVWVAHSTEADIRGSFLGSNLLAPVLRRWYQKCYALGDLVLTPTPYAKGLWENYGLHNPIEPLTNGVDTDFFQPDRPAGAAFRKEWGIDAGVPLVVGVGHYFRRKGIVDFVQLARRLPSAEFWWFGHTDLRAVTSDVREQVRTAPENCHFPGFVSREQLRDAYRAANLFLFPTYEETEGIALLEALACCTPVLVRNIPVYGDWLTNGLNVHLFDTGPELQGKAQGILSGEVPDLTRAGRTLALEHSYEHVASRLQALYARYGIVQQTP